MDSKDVNILAQLLIAGFDLWFSMQGRKDELLDKSKEQLLDRLIKANKQLQKLQDLET